MGKPFFKSRLNDQARRDTAMARSSRHVAPWRALAYVAGVVVTAALYAWMKPSSAQSVSSPTTAVSRIQPPRMSSTAVSARPIHEEKPAAMSDAATYAATRLHAVKAEPVRWALAETWQHEFALADTGELQREVLGLAQQIGSESFLAVLSQALASSEQLVRLEAARSLAFLHEHELLTGVTIAICATDAEVRDEVMQVVSATGPTLQADLLRQTLSSSYADVQERTVELLAEHPSPTFFAILVEGMRTPDAHLGAITRDAIEAIVDRHFENSEEATRWWTANRNRYDEMMLLAR
jgi:hypothetical protein